MVGYSLIPACTISPRFLALLGAPPMTTNLSFSVGVGGLLKCKAVYLTDMKEETAEKEWEVRLPRTSSFYQLLTGETS